MEISKEVLGGYMDMVIRDCITKRVSRRRKDVDGFSVSYVPKGDDIIARLRKDGSDVLMIHLSPKYDIDKLTYSVTFESYVGYDKTVDDDLSEIEEMIDKSLDYYKRTWIELYKVKVFTKDDVKDLYDRVIESDKYDHFLDNNGGAAKEKKINSLIKRVVNKKYKEEVPMEYDDNSDPYSMLVNDVWEEIEIEAENL